MSQAACAHTQGRARRRRSVFLCCGASLLLALGSQGCAKARSSMEVDGFQEDELASLERELDSQERKLTRVGVRVTQRSAARDKRALGAEGQGRSTMPRPSTPGLSPGTAQDDAMLGGAEPSAPPADLTDEEGEGREVRDGDGPPLEAGSGGSSPASPASETTSSLSADGETDLRFRTAGGSRCERICELAASSCALSDRICGLARTHEGESRFEQACERSQLMCEAAQEACHACE